MGFWDLQDVLRWLVYGSICYLLIDKLFTWLFGWKMRYSSTAVGFPIRSDQ